MHDRWAGDKCLLSYRAAQNDGVSLCPQAMSVLQKVPATAQLTGAASLHTHELLLPCKTVLNMPARNGPLPTPAVKVGTPWEKWYLAQAKALLGPLQ